MCGHLRDTARAKGAARSANCDAQAPFVDLREGVRFARRGRAEPDSPAKERRPPGPILFDFGEWVSTNIPIKRQEDVLSRHTKTKFGSASSHSNLVRSNVAIASSESTASDKAKPVISATPHSENFHPRVRGGGQK